MAFPADLLDLTVELYLSGAWTDVTDRVMTRDGLANPLTITRGQSSEGAEVDRSTCAFTANNRDGDLSPRNPTGTWYGQLGRNTPCRVRKSPAPPGYLLMPVESDGATTPDSANLSITGDIDVRVDVRFDDWDAFGGLANKLGSAGQRSWSFYKNADGTLGFQWSADGTALLTATSTAAVSVPADGRLVLRVTLDVVNGANKTVTFYTGTAGVGGSFSQLGSAVTTAGNTSIFDSTTAVQLGRSNIGTGIVGRLYGAQVYQGIAGTLRADVDPSDEEPGSGGFSDGIPIAWTMVGDASVVRPDIRFSGELSDLPQRWDQSGIDVWVPVEASGVLRRLTQGATPLKSTLARGYTTLTGADAPKAYWPCEDGADAVRLASGLPGAPAMTIKGTPDLAANSDFHCSAAIPQLAGSTWQGVVPSYGGTSGDVQVWFLLSIPATGTTAGAIIMTILTTGTVRRWDVSSPSAANLQLRGYDGDGALLEDSGSINFGINGAPERIIVSLDQNGADIDWELAGQTLGATVGGLGGTFTANTVGRVTGIIVNPNGTLDDVAVGHIAVHDSIRDIDALVSEFLAYAGETAGRRVERLCGEAGVTFRALGDLDDSTALGAQLPRKLVDLLKEAAAADGGHLVEPRDLLGIGYRPRTSLYALPTWLTLDYDAKHFSSIEPVDDDQHVRNDVTVQREGGSSSRAALDSGGLSTQPPPEGVGTYDEQVTLSLYGDAITADHARFRVHLGTVDEARYPVLGLDLHRQPFTDAAALYRAVEDLDVGDRAVVTNPPAWLPPDDIAQLALGFTETMANKTHRIEINCAPAAPYDQVGTYADTDGSGGTARYDTQGTVLAEDLTTVETGADVTVEGPIWSHADGDFDVLIGGERMICTAVSGSGPSQTLTLTRSVNGVVKTHSTGAEVRLADPTVYAL